MCISERDLFVLLSFVCLNCEGLQGLKTMHLFGLCIWGHWHDHPVKFQVNRLHYFEVIGSESELLKHDRQMDGHINKLTDRWNKLDISKTMICVQFIVAIL